MHLRLPTIFAILAISAKTYGQADPPSQTRLSWGEDPRTLVRVVWQTKGETKTQVVEFGTTPKLGTKSSAKRVSYPYETGIIHEGIMSGLKPGTPYFYRVGDTVGGFSPVNHFRTAPGGVESFVFTAFGDHGINRASKKNIQNVIGEKPAFHLLLGDISYANGEQEVWDQYLRNLEPLSGTIPYMPTLGNHENEKLKTGEKPRIGYSAYLARFALPGERTHYTFDYSGARFIAFNSDKFADSAQLEWLDKTLAAARLDKSVRWIVMFHHHPLYGSCAKRGNNDPLIRKVQPLYDKYQVDLVLCGHDHLYERQFQLRGANATSAEMAKYRQGEGTCYVTCGGGGEGLYKFMPEQPARTAIRESTYCYLKVSIPARGSLVVEAKRLDGSPLDRFEIAPKSGGRSR